MNPHMARVAIDPPRAYPARRWRCQYCKQEGLWDELQAKECTYVYPPCKHCGGTPECTLTCPGMVAALARSDVHVAGGLPKETQAAIDEYKKAGTS